MSSGPVLYDVPGPDEKRRERRVSWVVGAFLVIVLVVLGWRLASNGVFDDRWRILVEAPPNFAGYQVQDIWSAVFRGLLNTLLAAVISLPLAMILAILLVSLRSAPWRGLRWLASAVIEIFRALPVVLVMLFGILVLPGASPLVAVVFGLVVYNAAVFAEILRAGISALPAGQTEAAYSLGMRSGLIYRTIQLPQSVRMMLPSLIAQGVVLIKDSSLGYIVGYAELLRQISRVADALTNADYLLPLLAVGAAVFVTLNVLLSRLAVWVQRHGRLQRRGARVARTATLVEE
ncbi:amino acid ABC transporter permease [Brachybacterium halotolerans subsp. kimchii]|uniref:amino acid ABC transporter permease n=1 Tax=Brachybacterium halotolerans TaxID=2795215 RepID=UPI001E2D47A7|nr:amino acid ABC transporter permease [Brachybacterium halotolerans]UEJ83683.1 amino acid ABC transporter permease [Brachybacterium halotolerans subsp. kimchii]